jgi:YHS domain-containing protein
MISPRLSAILFSLPLGFLAVGCGHPEQPADSHAGHGDADEATYTCPPCGMQVPADKELVEAGGMKFAYCNPACREEIEADPAKYAEFAVP